MFGRKKKDTGRVFRRGSAAQIDGKHIKCAVERFDDGSESTVGRSGAFIVKGDELLVYSEEKVIFRSLIDETDFSELQSRGGIIISGKDIEHGGKFRTLVVYYTYYI